ncbi:MAG TPA: hypothetical protein EYG81_03990 [Archaeoglobus profundus]|nr:hypothetical protein [Archaeoglobus profundus]
MNSNAEYLSMIFLAIKDPAIPIPAIILEVPATIITKPDDDKLKVTRTGSHNLFKSSRKPNSRSNITMNIDGANMAKIRKNMVTDLIIHSLRLSS